MTPERTEVRLGDARPRSSVRRSGGRLAGGRSPTPEYSRATRTGRAPRLPWVTTAACPPRAGLHIAATDGPPAAEYPLAAAAAAGGRASGRPVDRRDPPGTCRPGPCGEAPHSWPPGSASRPAVVWESPGDSRFDLQQSGGASPAQPD